MTPPEGLKDALEGEESEALAKKGRAVLKSAVKSLHPVAPEATAEEEVDVGEEEEEEDKGDRDSLVDINESEDDLVAATGVFAAGVDTITNALLVLLGKFDESHGKQDRSNRRMSFVILLMVAISGAMGWSVWRIEGIVQERAQERIAAQQVAASQRDATAELKKLTAELKKTNKKVDDVKAEQEKQPDIAIVPDGKGGGKVVIKAKECNGDKKDCERSRPKLPSPGKKPKADKPSVEIPIPGAKSPSTKKHQETPTQQPVPPYPPTAQPPQ